MLFSDCIHTISNNTDVPEGSTITTDIDAFSFVIITDTMNDEIKSALQDLLFMFGTQLSSIKIPSSAIGADKSDSIFGSSRNEGCQHLQSSVIGDILVSAETQVIHSPVKIAVHKSCREGIVSFLSEYPQQYPMKLADNKDICFDPRSSANTPPYGAIVDSLIKCCFVRQSKKHILHIADLGTRHMIDFSGDATCLILQMFEKVEILRNIGGVTVEMTQLDVAFNIPTRNVLVQWSYEKREKDKKKEREQNSSSFLANTEVEVWALHVIKTKLGIVEEDRRQVGTVRLKQKKWKNPRKIIIPLRPYLDKREDNSSDCSNTSDDSTYSEHTPNPFLTLYNHSLLNNNSIRSHLSMDSKSVYSLKFYSTVSHILTQNRSELPLTYSKMEQLPLSTMDSLKRFFGNMLEASRTAFRSVKRNGICARLEVSIRPSGWNPLGNSFRCHGHLIDVMAHVHRAIQECFLYGEHKFVMRTIPHELVYSKFTSLIGEVQALTRIRASVKFCDVFPGEKCALWLKAMVTTILCICGLAGQTKLKYLRNWMKDEGRYNPTNMTPTRLTSNHMDTEEESYASTTKQPTISDHTWKKIQYHLKNLRFSEDSTNKIVHALKTRTPLNFSRKLYQELSLIDKWHFAQNIRANLIPILVSYMKKDEQLHVSKHTTHHNLDEGGSQNLIHAADSGIFIPSHLAYSTDALHQFQDHSASPNQYNMGNLRTTYCQEPILLIITHLFDLSLLFDVHSPLYLRYLYHFIRLCHAREITLPNSGDKLHQLDPDSSDLDFRLASSCIFANRWDSASFHLICKGLGIEVIDCDQYLVDECLLASLCSHYHFPCQFKISLPKSLSSLTTEDKQLLNSLICETIKEDIVLEMNSHLYGKRHFYRYHDDLHIWIPNKSLLIYKDNYSVTQYTVIFESQDIYAVLDKQFNNHGILGYEMRTTLHVLLQDMSNFGSLCDSFLNDDATNNKNFCQANTLYELEYQKDFALLEQINTKYEHVWNMCHEVIVPCVALQYQSNIYVIDIDNKESHLHRYDKNSSKVVTHFFPGCDCWISAHLKCVFIMKEGQQFKLIIPGTPISRPVPSHKLFFLQNANKISAFNSHPQGRIRNALSVSDSLSKVLSSNEVKHEHFRLKLNDQDPLDLLNYFTEFDSSFSNHDLTTFFGDNIVSTLNVSGITSTSTLLSKILSDYKLLPHTIICPLVCLKYKLWISVWEDEAAKNEKSKKITFFYGFDSRHNKVVCEVIKDHYIHLPFQSHFLYIKSTGNNKFGWWKLDEINPFTSPNYTYCYANNLTCKFSYLDNPLKTKVITLFKNKLRMRIFDQEQILKDPTLFHNSGKVTIVPLEFYKDGSVHSFQHGLLVIYPFNERERKSYGSLIHNNISMEMTSHIKNNILRRPNHDPNSPHVSISDIHVEHNVVFCSTFLLMVYIYIANSSKNCHDLTTNLSKLQLESDIDHKSKTWLVSLLIHTPPDATFIPIPQWLHQIANTTQFRSNPFNHNEYSQNDDRRTQKRTTNVRIDSNTSKKMRMIPSKSLRTARNYTSSVFKHILGEGNIFFSDDYKQFVDFIHLKAEMQANQTFISTPTRADRLSKSKKDIVSRFYKTSISAIEFQSLVEKKWISHEVINFISKICQQENQKIHIYNSHFMGKYLTQPNEDFREFHTQIGQDVEYLYIPINHDGNHWLLCRMDFSKKQILLLNSISNEDYNQNYLSSLKTYVSYVVRSLSTMKKTRHVTINADKWKGDWTLKDGSDNSPPQSDIHDSGIFTILNMCLFILGVKVSKTTYSQTMVINHKIRERLAKIIFDFTDWEQMHNTLVDEEVTSQLDSRWQQYVTGMFYQCYNGIN